MQIRFTACPIVEVNEYPSSVGPARTFSTSPLQRIIDPEIVVVKNEAEMATAFAAYVEKAKATGKPVCVSWHRPANDRTRAFPGFNKLKERRGGDHPLATQYFNYEGMIKQLA